MSMILRTNNPSVAEGHSNFRKSIENSLLFVRVSVRVCVSSQTALTFAFVRARSS